MTSHETTGHNPGRESCVHVKVPTDRGTDEWWIYPEGGFDVLVDAPDLEDPREEESK